MIDAVFQANRKGVVEKVEFFDDQGVPLNVAWVRATYNGPNLVVDPRPPKSRAEKLGDVVNPPVADPYQVTPPASLSELTEFVEGESR